jgi:RNA polymerase-binding transcription factor DksA
MQINDCARRSRHTAHEGGSIVRQRHLAELDEMRTLLRRRRAVLLERWPECGISLQHAGAGHAVAQQARAAAGAELAQIEAALARLDAGVYGICAGCGVCLTRDYLRADPTAQWCPRCRRAPRAAA